MAKVIKDKEGVTHLRGTNSTLCSKTDLSPKESDVTLTCSRCAAIALRAIELTTKAERRLWRQL